MKVLVTGGLGFIGSHTCCELLNNDYEVVVVDNFQHPAQQHHAENPVHPITPGQGYERCSQIMCRHMPPTEQKKAARRQPFLWS